MTKLVCVHEMVKFKVAFVIEIVNMFEICLKGICVIITLENFYFGRNLDRISPHDPTLMKQFLSMRPRP